MTKKDLEKQIELLVKDDEISQQTIINQRQEIERLTKQNKALNEMYELTKKEYIRLNNIINGVEDLLKRFKGSYREIPIQIALNEIKELKGE